MCWGRWNSQLTVYEVISNGSTITQTVIVDVATFAIKVFGNGDQVANGGSCANVREILPGLMPQAGLSKVLPLCIHDIDLGVEVLEVGRV